MPFEELLHPNPLWRMLMISKAVSVVTALQQKLTNLNPLNFGKTELGLSNLPEHTWLRFVGCVIQALFSLVQASRKLLSINLSFCILSDLWRLHGTQYWFWWKVYIDEHLGSTNITKDILLVHYKHNIDMRKHDSKHQYSTCKTPKNKNINLKQFTLIPLYFKLIITISSPRLIFWY